ncbi:MAG: hypothetical protein ABI670_19295 [Chloroflexota bacterium]
MTNTKYAVSIDTLLAVAYGGFGGNPNPDDPNEPHGPGSPVIRSAAALVAAHTIRAVSAMYMLVKAMPSGETQQAFQSAADTTLSRFVDEFCGTPPRVHWPWPWPDPDPWPFGPSPEPWLGPHPEPWFGPQPEPWRLEIARLFKEPQASDQIMAGLQFFSAARGLEDGELKGTLQKAGEKLIEAGMPSA